MTWNDAADAATTFGGVIAGLSLIVTAYSSVVAVRAYQAQQRSAADAHMHGLFREYLVADADGRAESGAFRLYTFEEM